MAEQQQLTLLLASEPNERLDQRQAIVVKPPQTQMGKLVVMLLDVGCVVSGD
jgi:hypothetical protein